MGDATQAEQARDRPPALWRKRKPAIDETLELECGETNVVPEGHLTRGHGQQILNDVKRGCAATPRVDPERGPVTDRALRRLIGVK
jgi:hypothetical protein